MKCSRLAPQAFQRVNNKPQIRTVLFDLDGTLADTAPDIAAALNTLRAEQGQAPLPYTVIRPVVSHGTTALVQLGCGIEPSDAAFEALRGRFLELYGAGLAEHTRLFPGMPELLARLEAQGLNWGIVTNKPSFLTDPLVKQLGLEARAACVVSGDTTKARKPDPAPMLHACALAGSSAAECLYVGDAQRDIEAGRNAGMGTLVALYGYISEQDTPQDWGASGMVEEPDAIWAWID